MIVTSLPATIDFSPSLPVAVVWIEISFSYSSVSVPKSTVTLFLDTTISNGVDLRTVQEVLGHEHLNTTEIYTHIENTELKIAAEANPLSRPAPKETHYEKDPVI